MRGVRLSRINDDWAQLGRPLADRPAWSHRLRLAYGRGWGRGWCHQLLGSEARADLKAGHDALFTLLGFEH